MFFCLVELYTEVAPGFLLLWWHQLSFEKNQVFSFGKFRYQAVVYVGCIAPDNQFVGRAYSFINHIAFIEFSLHNSDFNVYVNTYYNWH